MAEPHGCLARVPVFSSLEPAQQRVVESFAHPVRVAAGALLVHAGTRPERLHVLHEGRVKLVRTSADGHERVLRIVEPGDVVGEVALLTGEAAHHDAIALSPVAACVIDATAVETILAGHPDVGRAMLASLARRVLSLERLLASMTAADVGTRLAAYLIELPTRRHDGRLVVHLPMAKKDVASLLGTTPETLSRQLASLTRRGVLTSPTPREVVVLDPEALEEIAESGE